ncbi:MAG: radical SAM protein [bacterium]|nr:radical SAM protein [bacterium]
MKILLIQPDCTNEVNKDYFSLQYPVNLGYIAAALQEADHEVMLVDFNVIDRDRLLFYISEYKPDFAGVTSMTSSIYNAKKIISEIKRTNKEIVTILGGIHASTLPVETMNEIDDLDYLVFGEGERTIVELIETLTAKSDLKRVKGIVFRKDDVIIKNNPRELIHDLDSLPFPARGLVPLELYSKQHVTRGFSRKDKKIVEILISRGCPNRCIFCAGHVNYGFDVRFRSYENIIKEIQYCVEVYGTTHISIEDDTFTLNKELVVKLCNFFKEMRLTWNCNTRVDRVDYGLLRIMKESGCRKVTFGIESGNREMLKKIKKGITIPIIIRAVRNAKKAGIRFVECDFIIGAHIDESPGTIEDTVKLIYTLMPDFLAIAILCPYPGTEMYDIMVENKYLNENPDWSQFSYFGDLRRYDRLKYISSKQMHELQYSIMRKYYTSIKYIISQFARTRSLEELKYFMRLGFSLINEFLFNKKDSIR